VEHGYQGNIFEAYTLCQENDLNCIYGVEAYYVDDINDKSSRAMYHIILIAMTENARREINRIMSTANTEGYYYKPRIDLNLLLSLP
jgi:DNA polymerase III alpha subunit